MREVKEGTIVRVSNRADRGDTRDNRNNRGDGGGKKRDQGLRTQTPKNKGGQERHKYKKDGRRYCRSDGPSRRGEVCVMGNCVTRGAQREAGDRSVEERKGGGGKDSRRAQARLGEQGCGQRRDRAPPTGQPGRERCPGHPDPGRVIVGWDGRPCPCKSMLSWVETRSRRR